MSSTAVAHVVPRGAFSVKEVRRTIRDHRQTEKERA